MSPLRKFLAGYFWFLAVIYSFPAVALPPFLLSGANALFLGYSDAGGASFHALSSTSLTQIKIVFFLLLMLPTVVTLSSALAAWKFHRGEPGLRPWALVSGTSLVLLSLVIFGLCAHFATSPHPGSPGLTPLLVLGLFPLVPGTLILLAFFKPDGGATAPVESRQQQRNPAKGKGTESKGANVFLLVLPFIVGIVVMQYFSSQLSTRAADENWYQHGAVLYSNPYLMAILALYLCVLLHVTAHALVGLLTGASADRSAGRHDARWTLALELAALLGRLLGCRGSRGAWFRASASGCERIPGLGCRAAC